MTSLDRFDLDACNARLRNGSRSFYAASFLLPRRVREPAAALYAFCRVADDAIDQSDSSAETLAELRHRLNRLYAGQPLPYAEDRAFASVVRHFNIPRVLPEALLEGFEWDIEERSYEDIEDLHGYSTRVAGTVGSMMAIIMGARTPAAIARACELGMAMQLTNIARDVGEDARAGRLYLPRLWLREAGLDPDQWLAAPVYNEALGQVVQRLLRVADEFYARSNSGLELLPFACRMGIRSAGVIYAEIGRAVERHGMDSVNQRAVVPIGRKLALIWQALHSSGQRLSPESFPVPEAARYLVDAVAASPSPRSEADQGLPSAAWWELDKRFAWTLDLFDDLERRERLRRS